VFLFFRKAKKFYRTESCVLYLYSIIIVIIIKWFADNIVEFHRIFRYFNFSSLFLTFNDKITYNGSFPTPVLIINYKYSIFTRCSVSVSIFFSLLTVVLFLNNLLVLFKKNCLKCVLKAWKAGIKSAKPTYKHFPVSIVALKIIIYNKLYYYYVYNYNYYFSHAHIYTKIINHLYYIIRV